MKDEDKTKAKLINELVELRQRTAKLEKSETEHKQAEAVLRESEETTRALLNATMSAAFLIDATGTILAANETGAQGFSKNVDEIVGLRMSDLLPPEIAENRKARGIEVVLSGKPVRFEDELGGRWFDTSIYPVFDQQRRVIRLTIYARDITERKRIEESLRKAHDELERLVEDRTAELMMANEQLKLEIIERKQMEQALQKMTFRNELILQTTMDGFLTVDIDGNILRANHAMSGIVGYSPEKMIGMHLQDFEAQETPEETRKHIKRVMKNGSDRFETKLWHQDGRILDLEVSTNFIEMDEERFFFSFFRDITERKRAEEALRESEEWFRILYEKAPLPHQSLDENGYVLDVNPAWLEKFGYCREEVIGRYFVDFLPPKLGDHFRHLFPRFKTVGRIEGVELEMLRKDCSTVTMSYNGVMLYDKEGRFKQTHCILEDITERKRAEEALRESQEFSSSLLSSAPNAIIVISSDTSIRYVNPALESLTGFSAADLIGRRPPYPWWIEERVEQTNRYFQEALREGAHRVERPFQKRNGERCWVEITATPISSDGELKYFVSNWVDITERKRAEEALRESEQQYRTLFEDSRDAVYISTRDGRLVDANRSFLNLFGYMEEQTVNLDMRELYVNPHDRSKFQREIEQKGSVRDYEVKLRKKDGTEMHCLITSTVRRDVGGRILGYQGIVRDITERKRAEEELRKRKEQLQAQAATLEEANIALKVLLNRREEDRAELEERILANVKELVHPYLEKLKKSRPDDKQKCYLDILESNINDIISPFLRKLSSKYLNLTPTQLQVANLVKAGKTNKEISELMNLSSKAIEFHRDNMRNKLGIKHKKINLRSYLLSLQ